MFRTFAPTLSLLAVVLMTACAAAPDDLDVSLTQPSVAGKFLVALQPPQTPAAINQIHSWQVKLTTPAGVPVRQAQIAVDGGMPQHGHGLPTRPRVTKELADGTYLLEGMKFSMTGWWEVKLSIQSPMGSDQVTFNTIVASPAVAR